MCGLSLGPLLIGEVKRGATIVELVLLCLGTQAREPTSGGGFGCRAGLVSIIYLILCRIVPRRVVPSRGVDAWQR